MDFAFTDKIRFYGRINQISNTQSGYSIGVLPGPPWGLVKGFYNAYQQKPSINVALDAISRPLCFRQLRAVQRTAGLHPVIHPESRFVDQRWA